MSITDMVTNEVRNALKMRGLDADVQSLGKEILVIIKVEDIVEKLISSFPEAYRPMVSVDASDIKVRIRMV